MEPAENPAALIFKHLCAEIWFRRHGHGYCSLKFV